MKVTFNSKSTSVLFGNVSPGRFFTYQDKLYLKVELSGRTSNTLQFSNGESSGHFVTFTNEVVCPHTDVELIVG